MRWRDWLDSNTLGQDTPNAPRLKQVGPKRLTSERTCRCWRRRIPFFRCRSSTRIYSNICIYYYYGCMRPANATQRNAAHKGAWVRVATESTRSKVFGSSVAARGLKESECAQEGAQGFFVVDDVACWRMTRALRRCVCCKRAGPIYTHTDTRRADEINARMHFGNNGKKAAVAPSRSRRRCLCYKLYSPAGFFISSILSFDRREDFVCASNSCNMFCWCTNLLCFFFLVRLVVLIHTRVSSRYRCDDAFRTSVGSFFD